MPFIKIKTSTEITPEQEVKIKAGLGQAIRLIPGKSEQYLLLEFEDRCRMWLRGQNDDPVAYIEAAIFGNEDHEGFDAFSAAATEIFSEELKIRPKNIYIKFEDIGVWGAQGMCNDRNRYR